jgi:hypothetical protein
MRIANRKRSQAGLLGELRELLAHAFVVGVLCEDALEVFAGHRLLPLGLDSSGLVREARGGGSGRLESGIAGLP